MTLGYLTGSSTTTGILAAPRWAWLSAWTHEVTTRHWTICRSRRSSGPSTATLRSRATTTGCGSTAPRSPSADAGDARFAECAFTGGTGFDGGRLRRARLSDVWFGETRLVAVDMAESSLTDVWFSGCVLAGVQAFSCVRPAGAAARLQARLGELPRRQAHRRDLRGLRAARRGLRRRRSCPGCGSPAARSPAWTSPTPPARTWTCAARASGLTSPRASRRATTRCAASASTRLQLMTLAPLLAHHLGITVAD